MLFDGYHDDFLTLARAMPFVDVQDKFGFFYKVRTGGGKTPHPEALLQKNATVGTDGHFSMATANDENFGRILTWNYSNRTNYYEGSCGDIRGSAGEFYSTDRTKDSTVEIFSAELCKNAVLKYEEEVEIEGVRGYKYSARDLFDNGKSSRNAPPLHNAPSLSGTLYPENECYCGGECVPSGVLNVSACRQNSPTFLSLPHFYGADPYFLESIEGLKPEKAKHEFYVTLEPVSRTTLEGPSNGDDSRNREL